MFRRHVTSAPVILNYELSVRARLKGAACGFIACARIGAADLNGLGSAAAVRRIVYAVLYVALYSLFIFLF